MNAPTTTTINADCATIYCEYARKAEYHAERAAHMAEGWEGEAGKAQALVEANLAVAYATLATAG